jgi:hypothetical protein
MVRVKRWEIIADNLSKAGFSWGCGSAIDSNGRCAETFPKNLDSDDHFDRPFAFNSSERQTPKPKQKKKKGTTMNSLTQFKKISILAFPIALMLVALAQNTQAVSPAPDGGYPGGNTAEGQNALFSLTTGGYNTAVGFLSLRNDTTGQFNTAIGAGTLLANTSDENTATGAGALFSNTNGSDNTANGAFALFSNTTGSHNTATGVQALLSNTTGDENTAIGLDALPFNTTGVHNTANGAFALFSNTIGVHNTATGWQALYSNNGNYNTANGADALYSNTTGIANTAVGSGALGSNTTGVGNTALGEGAGDSVTTASNVICIGSGGANVSNSCYIANIYGNSGPGGNIAVSIDPDGKLGTNPSSRRFKEEIKRMDRASESILAFKPVTFHYKSDTKGTPQFGLIAEEVADVNPDLVVRDKNGEIYTVRYEAVNVMLLNEFLKEHRKVQEQEASITQLKSTVAKQEATIAQQQKGMEAVTARLNEQAAQIQKVSAQLEVSKAAPQTVLNDQ